MAEQKEEMDLLATYSTFEEYDKIWKVFVAASPTNEPDRIVLERAVKANNFIGKTMTLMDIGAGHGNKAGWIKDMGVNLKYVYAVEPNPLHCQRIRTAYQSLEVEHDVDERPFADDFTLLDHKKELKFDFVLMCHSAYFFRDKLESTIAHAHSFLKPGGKLVVITEGAPNDAVAVMENILDTSHPERLTADEIIVRLRKKFPSMVNRMHKETVFVDVDEIVQGTADTNSASWAYVSTALYSPIDKMNERKKSRLSTTLLQLTSVPREGTAWKRHLWPTKLPCKQ